MLQWRSQLVIKQFDLLEVREAILQGRIPPYVDVSQPWCELQQPLRLISDRVGEFHIPAGFVYDQASLPGAVRWYMSPSDPRINKAACWHDYLSPWKNEQPPAFAVNGKGKILTSVEAAEELYEGMRASGANWMDAALCSRAVKTFGPKF
jgi:hypothetical protein